MFFNHNKEPTISLYKKRINWVLLSRLLKWILSIICLVALCEMLFNFSLSTLVNGIWWCITWYLSISLVRWCKKHFKYHRLLHYFLKANKLYTEAVQDGKSFITSSAILGWKETDNKIIILAYKMGDAYSKRLESLDTELSALLNLPLEAKIIQPSVVEYHFYTTRPTRLQVNQLNDNYTSDISINLGYGITYSPVDTPHILVAGGTGSGKSIFISYIILELLKRKSSIYICDPKNSDLGSLSHYIGNERVATTPNQIAKVIRLAVEEMNNRYAYMRDEEHFKYGSNFADHGFTPTWIIFDEKGNKKTIFNIPPLLTSLLAEWKAIQKEELSQFNINQTEEQLVFTYIDTRGNLNSPLHADYLNNKMKSVKRRHPTLAHATPHKLRHTGATLAKQAGMSLEAISEALTHSDTLTTKTYVNTSNVVSMTAGQVALQNLKNK